MNTDTTTYTRPALGLGSAALDEQEEQAAVETLRSRNLFRYYGDDPAEPPHSKRLSPPSPWVPAMR